MTGLALACLLAMAVGLYGLVKIAHPRMGVYNLTVWAFVVSVVYVAWFFATGHRL